MLKYLSKQRVGSRLENKVHYVQGRGSPAMTVGNLPCFRESAGGGSMLAEDAHCQPGKLL